MSPTGGDVDNLLGIAYREDNLQTAVCGGEKGGDGSARTGTCSPTPPRVLITEGETTATPEKPPSAAPGSGVEVVDLAPWCDDDEFVERLRTIRRESYAAQAKRSGHDFEGRDLDAGDDDDGPPF